MRDSIVDSIKEARGARRGLLPQSTNSARLLQRNKIATESKREHERTFDNNLVGELFAIVVQMNDDLYSNAHMSDKSSLSH